MKKGDRFDRGASPWRSWPPELARTDRAGEAVFPLLGHLGNRDADFAGSHAILLLKPGYPITQVFITGVEGDTKSMTPYPITMSRSNRLHGRLLDAKGRARKGVSLALFTRAERACDTPGVTAEIACPLVFRTHSKGDFDVPGLSDYAFHRLLALPIDGSGPILLSSNARPVRADLPLGELRPADFTSVKLRIQDVQHVADEIRRMATMESHMERKAALAWMLKQPRTLLRQAFPLSHRYVVGVGGGPLQPRKPYWGEERGWDAWECRSLCRLPELMEQEPFFLACYVMTEAEAWTKMEMEYAWADSRGYGPRSKVVALAAGLQRDVPADLAENPCYLNYKGKDLAQVLQQRAVDSAAFTSAELTSVALWVEEKGGKIPFTWMELAKKNLGIEKQLAIHAILERLCRDRDAKQRERLAGELLSTAVVIPQCVARRLAVERATWVLSTEERPWSLDPMAFVEKICKGWKPSNRVSVLRALIHMGIHARSRPASGDVQKEIDREMPRLVAGITPDESYAILRGYLSRMRIDQVMVWRELVVAANAGSPRWRRYLADLRPSFRPEERVLLDRLEALGKKE